MGVDLMRFDEIQEEIQRYSKAAGAGNFDRTVFEYNSVFTSGQKKMYETDNFVISKIITPEEGTYKITFQCGYNSTEITGKNVITCSLHFDKHLYVFHPQYISSTSFYSGDFYSDFFSNTIGQKLVSKGQYQRTIADFKEVPLNSGFKSMEIYTYLKKGEPVVFDFTAYHTDTTKINNQPAKAGLTLKNFKITY